MPPKLSKSVAGRRGNVFLYVPNLIGGFRKMHYIALYCVASIVMTGACDFKDMKFRNTKFGLNWGAGYLRIGLALYAFSVANTSPMQFVISYGASFVCDELDGRFARMLNQTSTFGSVLDMVTDRVATSSLLAILCSMYPSYQFLMLSLLMLDIFSHWFQTYATLAMGEHTHKDINSRSFIVRFYYQHRIFMGFCCVCVEMLYLCAFLIGHEEFKIVLPISLPIPHRDTLMHPTLLHGIAAFCIPGFLIKQYINVAQLGTAAQQLVEYDALKASQRSPAGKVVKSFKLT